MYDLIIVGGGPAGMTSAVYAARKKLRTIMVTREIGGQIMWTRDIENYMGYQYITGPELTVKFEEQMRQYPIEIVFEEVIEIESVGPGKFRVVTEENDYSAKAIIIASGKRPKQLNIPGETKYIGLGVSYCATCDGPLYSRKTVAVVGGGNSALQAALELSQVAEKVFLVACCEYVADPIVVDRLKQVPNIVEMMQYDAVSINGSQYVESFTVRHNKTGREISLPVQGIFIEIGLIPNSGFTKGVVKTNELDEIIVDCSTRTNIAGIYAAGDVTISPDKQIVIAAGDGAKAVLSAYHYLLNTEFNQ